MAPTDLSDDHPGLTVLCKHILACLLAERLNMFQERDVTYDYIATISS